MPPVRKVVIGDASLFQGDCLAVTEDTLDQSVDMVLADPPYGTTACKWDSIISFEPMWQKDKATNHLNAKRTPMRRNEDVVVFYN